MPESFLLQKLQEREAQHLLRRLTLPVPHQADFSSNDYLGLSHSGRLSERTEEALRQRPDKASGSTGSRLISGNTAFAEQLEEEIAAFHGAEASLLFGSGYAANVGLLSCLAQKGDTYISDELCHASLIDGMRLSYAQRFRFSHSDLDDLEEKLQRATGNKFVVIESVYSMDGDAAPLDGIIALCEQYGAHLIVDEAHGIGVFGPNGEGLCQGKRIFARVYTYGKAPGCHGAAVVGSQVLKSYLINFSRAFIYTTAMPYHSLLSIHCAYALMREASPEREALHRLISRFREETARRPWLSSIHSLSAIQGLLFPGNENVLQVAQRLQGEGIGAKAIRYPTVAAGTERIRFCLHAFNTEEEIGRVFAALDSLSQL